MKLNIVRLGLISYGKALEIQYELLRKRQNEEIGDTLLLLEHLPVITLGTRGKYENIYLPEDKLKEQDVEIFETNRGGDVTYHGPGQIVGYPIMDLTAFDRSIRTFINKLEYVFINLLKEEFNIEAFCEKNKYTGVWVKDKKITAIGIAVNKWVTMHGFAFNVNTDLTHFEWINPCGLSKGVTSVEELIGVKADMDNMFRLVEEYFVREYGLEPVVTDIDKLL